MHPERTEWRWPASRKVFPEGGLGAGRVTRASRCPFSCLGLLAVAASIVNFGRWGNPFFFGASYSYWIQHHPNVIVAVP